MHPAPHDLPPGYAFKPEFELTPCDAKAALDAGKLLLVDVRTRGEWDASHVAGSVHIPLDELDKRWDEIEPGPGQSVGVLCHHGVRSMRAALMLREVGKAIPALASAKSVAAGIDQWSLSADKSVPRYERGPTGVRVLRV